MNSAANSNSNLSNINLNAEVIPLNNIKADYKPEYHKGLPTTPNRPTKSIFGSFGKLPSNIPSTPNPIRRITRWKGKTNKKRAGRKASTRRVKRRL